MKYIQSLVLLSVLVQPVLAQPAFSESVLGDKVLALVKAKYGPEAYARVKGWGDLIVEEKTRLSTLSSVGPADVLARANDYFNQVQWLSDMEHWGVEDYWATPVETLATNGGDCEDFSIGKYFSLLESEFDPAKLRITYVKSLEYNQAHMVLAYYETPGAEPLILDNINKQVLPASQRKDLLPIYSFNGESIWLARDRGRALKGNSQVSLPKWKDVNKRMLKNLR